jgi:hypothetical protein
MLVPCQQDIVYMKAAYGGQTVQGSTGLRMDIFGGPKMLGSIELKMGVYMDMDNMANSLLVDSIFMDLAMSYHG